jgi:MiaB-like tRNA modifying enzyme
VKVFIETYGCTANKADSDSIAALLVASGHKLSKTAEAADMIVLNSCGVKDAVEKKIIHRAKLLLGAGRRVVLCGCLPYINVDETQKLEDLGVELVGLDTKRLEAVLGGPGWKQSAEDKTFTKPIARVSICSGCLSNCTFCATKLARGKLKSNSRKDIIEWVSEAVRKGAKEIQLTGQDIGCYGIDNDVSLASLLSDIEKIEGDFKVRLGMLNPNYIKRLPRSIFASDRFYHYIHIPIQSGNKSVLKDMGRACSTGKVAAFVQELREEFGDQNITFWTDMIVGFPTEGAEAFADSVEFVRDTRPDVVNVSRFWPRPNTAAASLKQLPFEIVKRRSADMLAECRRISTERNRKHIGLTEKVLVLEQGTKGTLKGRNDAYKQIILKAGKTRQIGNIALGTYVPVRIKDVTLACLIGEAAAFDNV